MAARTAEEVFSSLGLDKKRAADSAKSDRIRPALLDVARAAGVAESGCDKAVGNLLYALATELPASVSADNRTLIARNIASSRLTSKNQLLAAFKFTEAAGAAAVAEEAFDRACGIGVTVSAADIERAVSEAVAAAPEGKRSLGDVMKALKADERLRWADQAEVRRTLERLLPASDKKADDKKPAAAAPQQQQQQKAQKDAAIGEPVEDPSLPAAQTVRIGDLTAHKEERVRVQGWVANVREASKNLVFIVLRDGTGYLQVVFSGARLAHSSLIENRLLRECTVEVTGTLGAFPAGKNPPDMPRACPLELHADWWKLVGASTIELEALVTPESDVPQKLDQRHIILRGPRASSMLIVRSAVLQAFREWYWDRRFIEVTPPTIVQTFCEGGSDLFKLDYYGEPAYMTQSSQLYLETVIPAVKDTFCILPSFRAEKSRTPRHLSEYTHLEAEMAFIQFEDLLGHLESIICDVTDKVMQRVGDIVMNLNPKFVAPKRPFFRLSYRQAIEYCRANNIINSETGKPFEYGEDITEKPEREMTNRIGKPILMMRFPTAMKAFYMRKCADDETETESVDVLMPGVGEIVGGSMRIHNYEELMRAYQRVGIDPKPYYWFTDQRRFGTTPHGGYGIGVERLLMWMLGEDHIRNLCLYPRYIGRASP
eukprot:m51a1_g6894 putative asparaginyl-trna synthetase (657) ;mRNA; f:10557-12968